MISVDRRAWVPIRDRSLMAALLYAGVPPHPEKPLTVHAGDSQRREMNFLEVALDGTLTAEIIEKYRSRSQGIAYVDAEDDKATQAITAIENRKQVQRLLNEAKASFLLKTRSGGFALLEPDLARGKEEFLLQKLGV